MRRNKSLASLAPGPRQESPRLSEVPGRLEDGPSYPPGWSSASSYDFDMAYNVAGTPRRSRFDRLRVHALQKPIRRDLPAHPVRLGLLQDRGAYRRELQPDADIVEKAGRFLHVGAALRLPRDQIFELRRGQPKWMLDFYLMGAGGTFADDVDGVMGFDAFFAEAGNVVLRRVLMRVNHQPVDSPNRVIAELRYAHAS